MFVPIAFKNYNPGKNEIVLAGDLGGTKINIALFKPAVNAFEILKQQSFHSKDYTSLSAVIKEFAGENIPATICFAVAGPVRDGKVKLTNLSWQLDSTELSKELGKKIVFINDLEANAYGLAALKKEELFNLSEGEPAERGNMAILAPGTGLGEAGLYWDGNNYFPFATEGGHCALASRSSFDFELYTWLSKQHGYVCYEHILSGPGIHSIFRFLSEEKKTPVPTWLADELKIEDPSAAISENAINGKSKLCIRVMDIFFQYLATEASNLVLKYKATGGLFISGGIPPKNLALLNKEKWRQQFFESDRMETLLQQTPVNIILNEKTPLFGAAYYASYSA
ncbi:MAG: glucokinase [Bacteroidetes bacterium]|nr:glucokinase [Bacteroidota bacterium]